MPLVYIATRLYRHSATAPGAQQLTLTSSSTLDRSRYLRSQISSGYIATWLHRHSTTSPLGYIATRPQRWNPASHFDELVYSGQVTLPEELDQLRLHCHSAISPFGHSVRNPAAHFDEFVYSRQVTLPEESDQLRLHCHSAISPLGHNARSPAAHFDEFVYSGQVKLPEDSDQLRLHCHSAISPLGQAPGAQQLTLTSSSTLDRSRYLRSRISSGYIATSLYRHSATAPRAQQLTLTSSSTLDRSSYLRIQISSGYIATRLYRHSAKRPEPSSSL